jgi:hypothetical protein
MRNYNPKNERAKKDYYRFLKEADRKAESTIDTIRKAIFPAYESRPRREPVIRC